MWPCCLVVAGPLGVCRCKLRRRAAVALAQGLRANRTLRQLNLAGVRGLDEAGAVALAGAVSCSKALTALNLAFVKLSEEAVGALIEVRRGVVFVYGVCVCVCGGGGGVRAGCLCVSPHLVGCVKGCLAIRNLVSAGRNARWGCFGLV